MAASWIPPAASTPRATFEHPTVPSAGIPFVIVNGTVVVRNGEVVSGAMAGRPVRIGGTAAR